MAKGKNPRRKRHYAVCSTFGGKKALKLSENNFRAAKCHFEPHCILLCEG